MSIPLTLGAPHRPDPQALVAGLLQQRCRTAAEASSCPDAVTTGPPVVDASVLAAVRTEQDLGRIVVDLDIDPDDLRRNRHASYEVVRYHVNVREDTLAEATSLRLPSPLVIFPDLTEGDVMETVTAIVDAHRTPGFGAWESPRRIADVLAVVAHAEVGFSARARSGEEVLAILAATVAALRGDDILRALAAPDVGALIALRPEAAEAVRTVLLGIEVDDAVGVHAVLLAAGLLGVGSV